MNLGDSEKNIGVKDQILYYFTLQLRRFQRKMQEFGIHPILAVILMLVGFLVGSLFLYFKTNSASYIYVGLSLSFILSLSERSKTETLEKIFDKGMLIKIRLIENMVSVLPFLLFLFYQMDFIESLVLFFCAMGLSLYRGSRGVGTAIPTPFWKFPIDFIVGFRKNIIVLIGLLILVAIAISVDNFNLGLFALVAMVVMGISFSTRLEKVFEVWVFHQPTIQFLRMKVWDAIRCNLLMSSQIVIALLVFYPHNVWFILGVELFASIVMIAVILSKYSAYPQVVSVPQGILLGISILIPPILLFVIPIFYKHAVRKLTPILK